MKRRLTAQDVRMLTDARDRLRAKLLDTLPRPLRRAQHDRFLNEPKSASAPFFPIDCNHGVPWTECATCSRARGGS